MNSNPCARFQSLSERKLIKNCRFPSWSKNHASWFRECVSWYMTWNTWELKLNSTILTHSKSKLMLILSILIVNWWIWIIKLHLWYFVTFGLAGETKRRLKDRFNEHRRPVDNPSNIYKPTTVSEHFLTNDRAANDITLIPQEVINLIEVYEKLERHASSREVKLLNH